MQDKGATDSYAWQIGAPRRMLGSGWSEVPISYEGQFPSDLFQNTVQNWAFQERLIDEMIKVNLKNCKKF